MSAKAEIVLSAPPVAVAGAHLFFGYSLPEWAALVTIGYTLVLFVRLVIHEFRLWRDR
jgi:disulfide bond formation protein DsbB